MGNVYSKGEIKAALAWVSDDTTREHIQAVLVGARRYLAATNGHGLFVVAGDPMKRAEEPVSVPADALERAVKTKGCVTVNVLDAEIVVGDKAGTSIARIPYTVKTTLVFPPVEQVIPATEKKVKIGIDLKYLRDMCQALLDAGASAHKTAIYIDPKDPHEPVRFEAEGLTGVLCPVRL